MNVPIPDAYECTEPKPLLIPAINSTADLLGWWLGNVRHRFGDDNARPNALMFPQRAPHPLRGFCGRVGKDASRSVTPGTRRCGTRSIPLPSPTVNRRSRLRRAALNELPNLLSQLPLALWVVHEEETITPPQPFRGQERSSGQPRHLCRGGSSPSVSPGETTLGSDQPQTLPTCPGPQPAIAAGPDAGSKPLRPDNDETDGSGSGSVAGTAEHVAGDGPPLRDRPADETVRQAVFSPPVGALTPMPLVRT